MVVVFSGRHGLTDDRLLPISFLDPRGAGLWDGRPLESTEAAIWAMDAAEAGDEGRVRICIKSLLCV